MAGLAVVYDSCVLFPAALRDLLVRLARTGMFRAHWTSDIHEECIRSLLEMRPGLSRERLERTRDLMNEHILDSLVTDYEKQISTINLPDPDDGHVVAAAIEAAAEVIVTFNLRDFPDSALAPLGITAKHPDEFVLQLLNADEETVCVTLRSQRLDLKAPPKSADELLDILETQGLQRSLVRLRTLVNAL